MPRRRSSFGRSRGSSSRRTSSTKAPNKQSSTQNKPQAKSGGMFSGLMGSIMTGMAFGAGSEVAHQAVRGVMNSGDSNVEQHAPVQDTQSQSQGSS